MIARPFVRPRTLRRVSCSPRSAYGDERARRVTEEDIHAAREAPEAGVIEEHERDMVRNVFRLDDRQLGSMVQGATWSPSTRSCRGRRTRSAEEQAHTLPGGARRHARDHRRDQRACILGAALHGRPPDLERDAQPPVYVPESLTAMELLQPAARTCRPSSSTSMQVLGIVALRDLFEATGEFAPQRPEDRWAVAREDGSWLLDGLIPIPELKDLLRLEIVPEQERYHTLSGMIMVLLGRLPRTADSAEWAGWRFEIVDMDASGSTRSWRRRRRRRISRTPAEVWRR